MEIELDKIAFTAEVKEGLYAGSSFRGESSDHQGTCKEGSEEGVNCQGTWGDRRDSPSSSKVLSDSQFPRLPVLFQSLSPFLGNSTRITPMHRNKCAWGGSVNPGSLQYASKRAGGIAPLLDGIEEEGLIPQCLLKILYVLGLEHYPEDLFQPEPVIYLGYLGPKALGRSAKLGLKGI